MLTGPGALSGLAVYVRLLDALIGLARVKSSRSPKCYVRAGLTLTLLVDDGGGTAPEHG